VPEDRVLLAHIHHWLGVSLKDIGFLEEAETEYRESHDLRKQLVAEQPHNVRLKHLLGHVKAYLAALLMNTDRLDEAEELLQQATAIDEKLLDDFPDVEDYRRVAGWDYELLGSVLSAMRRPREADAALRHSLAIREKLVADLPGVQSKHMDLATVRYNLGLLLESVGRTEEAAELFREAISTFENLTAADPEVPLHQNKLGWMLATCPAVQCRDPERAVKLAKQALKYEPEAVKHWRLLGIAQYRAGDPTAAIASLHKTMELANGGDAQQWLFLAMAHWQTGNHQEARQWYDKAVAWLDKNHPADEEYDRFRAEATELLGKPEAK
jgi:tetratricopeptide (TPR) repeat protein